MPRIACLRIHQFQIAVQQKHKETYTEALYTTIQRKLVTDLISCSPKVEAKEIGVILLDASGLSLSGGENRFCHKVLKTCSLSGFTNLSISIANSAFTAIVASQSSKLITIVAPHKDADFLAPLSIQHLKLSEDIENIFLTLGIKTLGQLAKIPVSELNKRFAKQGKIIWQPWELAQGIDHYVPSLPQPEKIFACMLDLGGTVSQFNEILFALKSMLDRLIAELEENGLLAQELVVSLFQDTKKFDERILPLIQPTNKGKFLLELIRLSLNAKPLDRELTAIEIKVSRFTNENWQQSTISESEDKNQEATNKISQAKSTLLQRFATRLGNNKIVQAQANNQYLTEDAGVWIPITKNALNSSNKNLLPVDLQYLQSKSYQSSFCDLVLRPTLPATQVLVQLNNKQPAAINYKKRWYKIKSITNPEYLSGQWWSKAVSKDFYKILAEPIISTPPNITYMSSSTHNSMNNIIHKNTNKQILMMLLTHDKLDNNWHIEGIYD